MSDVEVQSPEQINREALELSHCDALPNVSVVTLPDEHRALKLVVPIDPTHATWVEYEQAPIFVNATRTKFVISPPFEASKPPRFVLYSPHGQQEPIDRHMCLTVVDKNKPLDGDKTSIYSVFPINAPASSEPIARGLMIRRSDCTVTILDVNRKQEITILSKNIRLEREAVFRPGVGATASLLGHSDSSIPSPVGIRYGMMDCLSAKWTYLFDLRRRKEADADIPIYSAVLQHQFLIENKSAVKFSRVSYISITSETFQASEDGFPTRALAAASSEPLQLVRPFFSLHELKLSIRGHSSHLVNDRGATMEECYAVVTINVPPTRVGDYANLSMNVWMPTAELYRAAPQPGVAQLHVKHTIPGFDDVTAVTRWQRSEDQSDASVPWSRIVFPETATRLSAQCIVRQTQLEVDYVAISVVSYFSRPMLLAFVVQPGVPDSCSQIEAVSGARPLSTYPWMNSVRGTNYRVFVVEAYKAPISFRGTIITAK